MLAAALSAAACASDDKSDSAQAGDTSSTTAPSTTATEAPTTTTGSGGGAASTAPTTPTTVPSVPSEPAAKGAGVLVAGSGGLALARTPGGTVVSRLREGTAVSYDQTSKGWARILSPCENRFWAKVDDARTNEQELDVVLDPGHGGDEPGAVGPTGVTEKEINADIVNRVAAALRKDNISVGLTRPADYRTSLASRVAVAAALRPEAFVSIHHNAEPDGPLTKPGTEIYYQHKSADSKRLAGLVYEEVLKALSAYAADWKGDGDAGAKYRTNDSGGDYYGIIRRAGEAGLVANLAELAFLSNPTEEELLKRDDVRQAEADAVARGITRYLRTTDPGSGFTIPYPRTAPAGPGGGVQGCTDPLT